MPGFFPIELTGQLPTKAIYCFSELAVFGKVSRLQRLNLLRVIFAYDPETVDNRSRSRVHLICKMHNCGFTPLTNKDAKAYVKRTLART